ncbi:MAG: hypothetical protein KBE04_11065 [Phycisphaerae bacterium]|nr:hypothetical protein [Phycisphaerae bacterium]
MRGIDRLLILTCLAAVTGCQGSSGGGAGSKTDTLRVRISQLENQVVVLQAENEALRRQLESVPREPLDAQAREFHRLERIRLGGYTGFYDKDKDGTLEKLIVYVQPVDEAGDVVKASGAVDVQLWDLSADPNRALLGAWHVEPPSLHGMWFATLVTINYRLVFDRPADAPLDRPLTIKVVFTEGLSGKVFTEQRVVQPRQERDRPEDS